MAMTSNALKQNKVLNQRGGSYVESQLSNITLKWILDNVKACGLVFNEGALATCLGPKPFHPLGQAHDEWKLIPWGCRKIA
jgi:hypothetical protein